MFQDIFSSCINPSSHSDIENDELVGERGELREYWGEVGVKFLTKFSQIASESSELPEISELSEISGGEYCGEAGE